MPLPVAGVYAHYEADTLGLANGAAVDPWPDASGNGFDLTSADDPTYETNSLNGMGGVVFAGTQNLQDTSISGAPTARTVFMVVKNPPNDGTVKQISGGSDGTNILLAKWSQADRWIFGNDSTWFLEFTETGIVTVAGQWTYAHQQTGAFVRWNQVQKVSGNIQPPAAPTRIKIGDSGNTGTGFTMYEYIIYPGVLSGGDIDLVEDYLFTKWFTTAFTGSGASTLDGVTSAGSGTYTPPARTGTGASTLAGVTSAGVGTYTPAGITGTGTSTLDGVASTGSGTFALAAITGTGASTLGGVTSAGAGVFAGAITGTGASTLAGVTSVGVGLNQATADASTIDCVVLRPTVRYVRVVAGRITT